MPKLLSIITPFYNEQEGITHYFDVLLPILKRLTVDYEVVCIDDGSKDFTWTFLKEQSEKNHKIRAFRFSRNFGKEAALTAGLDLVNGDAAIPLDADLQDPPELIPDMITAWDEGHDVVLMKRETRKEGFIKNVTAKLFYKVIGALTNKQIPENVGDFRLMSRKVIDAVKGLREKNRFMKGVLSWAGFKSKTLLFTRPDRAKGKPKHNYRSLFRLAFDGIFSFSSFPLKIWTLLGGLVSLGAFGFGLWVVLQKLLYGNDVPGYPSLMVTILFLNGLLMISVGILGEYIRRIFDEVKNRPLYVIDESINECIKEKIDKKPKTKTN
jgi:glycosyltransferase involved in cell wall biosynthesis